ncbi:MAG TPA: Fur family transcriptional regulator [Candidatus Berkiella sp.]|nr:Fur family transcriptional regulator [Candidatus Berkiella sp.]
MTQSILKKAYKHCLNHGFRFTNPRELVLKILVNEQKPLGAYEILQKLSNQINNPHPQTVYRAIQFWHQEGFIHCIDSLKSYVACANEHHIGHTQFLVCTECNYAKELDCVINFSPISKLAKNNKFSIRNYTLEIKGLCDNCTMSPVKKIPFQQQS